jgi:hydroxymethylglutaryl-CoA lyase
VSLAREAPYTVNGHCDIASLPRSIHIAELGPRDGLQIEATLLTTPQKLEFIDRLVRAGVREIEIGSFVNPRAVPQMADTPALFQAAWAVQ